jgi:uncharacterized protein (TIGR02246 family)
MGENTVKNLLILVFVLCFAFAGDLLADTATHDHLRTLKESLVEAVNGKNIEKLTDLLHQNVVLTAENGAVSRGRDGVRSFYKKLFGGPNPELKNFEIVEIAVDEESILFDPNTAVAFGSGTFLYTLEDDSSYRLSTRWTASMQKSGESWQISSFHNSGNIFDNPILKKISSSFFQSVLMAGLIGIAIGAIAIVLLRKVRS